MRSGWSRVGWWVSTVLVLTLVLLSPAPAFAHKLYLYAQVNGAAIQGRAYFPGDVPAQKTSVTARDPAGRELDRTETDVDGKFTFTPRERVDHCLRAETPDGHGGQYIVHASELPTSLPTGAPAAGDGAQAASPAPEHASMPVGPAGRAGNASGLAAVETDLAELREQIQQLRRQIMESDERLRFRDILGGIGFILGLAGVAFYLKARGRVARP